MAHVIVLEKNKRVFAYDGWVDPDLKAQETFIGLYDCSGGISGESLANMLWSQHQQP